MVEGGTCDYPHLRDQGERSGRSGLFYPQAYGRENRVLRLLADAKIVVTPAVRNS